MLLSGRGLIRTIRRLPPDCRSRLSRMLRPRLSNRALSEAAGNRPGWLTNGVVNLAVLCVLIVLMGMLSPRLSRTGAGITFFVGLGVFALAASSFVGVSPTAGGALSAALRCACGGRCGLDHLALDGPAAARPGVLPRLDARVRRPLVDAPSLGVHRARHRAAVRRLLLLRRVDAFISPPGDIIAQSRGVRARQ